jgi:hypothetical protein
MLPGLAAPKTITKEGMKLTEFIDEALNLGRGHFELRNGVGIVRDSTHG